jgi:DNA-binding MarR family transcriptional regulator
MAGEHRDDAIELLHFGFHGAIRESTLRLAEADLNRMDHTLLYVAEKFPGATVGEFMQHYGASKQALSAPLRKLVTRGLVELRASAQDKRVRHVHLTPEGHRIALWLNAGLQESLDRAFRRAGPRARSGWYSVMRELASPLLELARQRGAYAPAPVGRTRPEVIGRRAASHGRNPQRRVLPTAKSGSEVKNRSWK